MTSSDSDADATASKYHIQIGEGQGIVIGDRSLVVQQFYDTPPEPQVDQVAEETYRQKVVDEYKWLDFSDSVRPSLSLAAMPLEKVFVRLTRTRTAKEGIQDLFVSEESSQTMRGEQRQREITVQEPIELSQALCEYKHLLIIGEPGAGKSTLLRWLAVTFAQRLQRESNRLGSSAGADRLPVLLELGRLPDRYLEDKGEIPNWLQLLPEYLSKQMAFSNIPPQLLTDTLDKGHCLLLFDGLDEVVNSQARVRLAHSLVKLINHFPNNWVIVSSRPGVRESEGLLVDSQPADASESKSTQRPQFQRCQIERFTPDDVRRFFHSWYAPLDGEPTAEQRRDADALYARVHDTLATVQLATTPLLSSILILLWRREDHWPRRRVELYERCCRDLIEQWEVCHIVAYRGLLDKVGWECHLRLLAPLAYSIHDQGQTSITRAELIPKLAGGLQKEDLCSNHAALREAELFLETLNLRSGLLQYKGDDRYGFPHLAFQEYLAARHIATQSDYIDLVMEHLHETWWQEVHLLTIAHLGSGKVGASKASALILAILQVYRPPSWILRSSKHWWLRLIGPGKLLPQVQLERRIAWLQAREFELAIRGYAQCASDGKTAKVGIVLSAQAASLARHILYDTDRYYYYEYLKAQDTPLTIAGQLSQRQINEAVVRVLLQALQNGNKDVRWRAAERLDQVGVGNEAVVRALLQALQNRDEDVWRPAVASLGRVGAGSEAAVNTLVRALLHNADSYMRESAAGSLGQIGTGNEAVVNALVQALLHDPDSSVRESAADSLGRVGVGNEAVVNALLQAVQNRNEDVRRSAAASLGLVGAGNGAVVSALLKALHDVDSRVREQAIVSLGQMGAGSEAAVSLRQVGADNGTIVSTLIQALLHDPDWGVRRNAATGLGQIGTGNETALNALVQALHDPDWGVRRNAATDLGQIGTGNETALNALVQALHDPDWRVRKDVAKSLGQIGTGNETALNALVQALHDPDLSVQSRATDSLGQVGVGNEAVVNALVWALLYDPDPQIRWFAASCLGQVGTGNKVVANALLQALHDPYCQPYNQIKERVAASLGLVGVGSEAVVNALVQMLLHDQYSNVRESAAISLGQVGAGNEAAVNALVQTLLHNADSHMRKSAVISLGQVGAGNETAVRALLQALHDVDPKVRKEAVVSLGHLEIKDTIQLRQVLVTLNCCLYDFEYDMRLAAMRSIQQLLDGRPIPGDHRVLLQKRLARKRWLKCVAFWLGRVSATC